MEKTSVRGCVSGRVQGVGFRYFVMRHARDQRLHGYVRNLDDGRVEFLLQGDPVSVDLVLDQIRTGPPYSRVVGLTTEAADDIAMEPAFTIR